MKIVSNIQWTLELQDTPIFFDFMLFVYDNNVLWANFNKIKNYTAEKIKFFIKDFFSKCDKIRRKLLD